MWSQGGRKGGGRREEKREEEGVARAISDLPQTIGFALVLAARGELTSVCDTVLEAFR